MDMLKCSVLCHRNANGPDKSEYFVTENWLEVQSEKEAVNEVIFFGNKNTICKLKNLKW